MTRKYKIKLKCKNRSSNTIGAIIFIPLPFLLVFISKEIAAFVVEGLNLCANTIIASVFPFMIISDLISSYCRFKGASTVSRMFERVFKINGQAISGFICGCLCGFPVGVKVGVDLYKDGTISKSECERLIGFSNNAGPAFVIGGIGCLIRGSIQDGVVLYTTMIISAIVVGWIFGIGEKASKNVNYMENKPFNFAYTVKTASQNTLIICGFVTIFSVICGVVKMILKNDILYAAFIPLLEVGNAAKILGGTEFISRELSLILTAFAISFSGISVHMQSKSFLTTTDISMKKYYLMKLLEGLLSATIISIFTII